jgi:hypothetical protein
MRKTFVPITSMNLAYGLNIDAFHWETTNFPVSFSKIAIQGFEYQIFLLVSVVNTYGKFVKGKTHRVHIK